MLPVPSYADFAHGLGPASIVLRSCSDGVVITDDQGLVVLWNPAAERVLGWTAAEALRRPLVELLPIERLTAARLPENSAWRGEVEVPDRGGRPVALDVEVNPVPGLGDGAGRRRGYLVICRDITALTRAARALSTSEARLRESEEQFRNLVEQMQLGVYLLQDNRFQYVNPKFAEIVGYSRAEVLELSHFLDLIHPDDRLYVAERQRLRLLGENSSPYSFRLQRKNGDLAHVEVYGTRTQNQGRPSIIGSLVDITERKHLEEELHRQAFYDRLTGLPNRALFQDRVERALTQARRSDQLVAVCFIDLDRFKQINDALGHATGDVFLQQVAQRLSRCLREGDTVARLGGDEFTLLLPALTDAQDAVRVADRVLAVLRQPFYVGPHLLRVTASVGISLSPHDGVEVADLLKHADAAMYRVKSAGKDGYQLFTAEVNAAALRRLDLEAQLWLALRDKQLRLCLLPMLDLTTGEVRGIEASPRWLHPTEGFIAPCELLSLSEDTELVVGLTRWTLRQGCRHAQALVAAGLPTTFCVISVPPRRLVQPELGADVRAALEDSGLLPQRLILVLQLDRQAVAIADLMDLSTELQQLGVRLVLGGLWDAGLPLQYLQALPLSALRLEPRFVHRLGNDPKALGLCEGLTALAHSVGLKIIAEGVDTPGQLATVQRLGCDLASGASVTWPSATAKSQSLLLESLQRDGGLVACT